MPHDDRFNYCKASNKTYGSKNKEIAALKDISLSIPKGTTLGIIGESGSGKQHLVSS